MDFLEAVGIGDLGQHRAPDDDRQAEFVIDLDSGHRDRRTVARDAGNDRIAGSVRNASPNAADAIAACFNEVICISSTCKDISLKLIRCLPVGLKGNQLQKRLTDPYFAAFLTTGRTTIGLQYRQNLSLPSHFFASILQVRQTANIRSNIQIFDAT